MVRGDLPPQEGECTFPLDHWESTLRTNLIARRPSLTMPSHTYPPPAEENRQSIGHFRRAAPWGNHLAYCVSKAGLSSLTKGLARALAPHVQVNAVAPGIVVFPQDYSPELRQKLIDKTLVGRAGTPEEVAALVLPRRTRPLRHRPSDSHRRRTVDRLKLALNGVTRVYLTGQDSHCS